jgi:lipid A 4'-phosphatase
MWSAMPILPMRGSKAIYVLDSWSCPMPSLAIRQWSLPQDWPLAKFLSSSSFTWALLMPAVILLCGTLLFRLTDVDMTVSGWFFNEQQQVWPLLYAQPWDALYHYGPMPGLVLGVSGWVVGLAGTLLGKWRSWGKAGIFLGLMLLLGPGLAINGVFKPHWGRPRPSQVEQFGGDHAFLKVGDPGWDSDLKSFPCGHASMGFYLMAPAFLCFRRHPRLALAFFLLGLSAGGFLGVARIVQGRHFTSDVLWSAGMVYYSGLLSYLVLGLWRWAGHWNTAPTPDPAAAEAAPTIFSIEQIREARAAAEKQADDVGRRKSA